MHPAGSGAEQGPTSARGPQRLRRLGPCGQTWEELASEEPGPDGKGSPTGGQCEAGHPGRPRPQQRPPLSVGTASAHKWGTLFMFCSQHGFYLEAQKVQLILGCLSWCIRSFLEDPVRPFSGISGAHASARWCALEWHLAQCGFSHLYPWWGARLAAPGAAASHRLPAPW